MVISCNLIINNNKYFFTELALNYLSKDTIYSLNFRSNSIGIHLLNIAVHWKKYEEMNMPNKTIGILALAGVQPYQEKPGEEYMNANQREHFKKILNAWRNQLREEVDRTVNHMQDEAANFPDPVDRAAQEEEFSLELRTRDRERKLIKKIEKTLKLIDEDDFGFCESCGIEIGIKRLEARPTADLCIECKTLAEIKERQMAG